MDIVIGRRNDLQASIVGLDINVLTGYEGRITIATEPGATPLLQKAGVIADAMQNKIDFVILPSDLSLVLPGTYPCDIDVWKTADPNYVYRPISTMVTIEAALGANPAV